VTLVKDTRTLISLFTYITTRCFLHIEFVNNIIIIISTLSFLFEIFYTNSVVFHINYNREKA